MLQFSCEFENLYELFAPGELRNQIPYARASRTLNMTGERSLFETNAKFFKE